MQPCHPPTPPPVRIKPFFSQYKRRYHHCTSQSFPRFRNEITCSNCNGRGHFFKDCKKPILSYGLFTWTLRPRSPNHVPGLRAAFANFDDLHSEQRDRAAFLEQMRVLYRTGQYDLQVCMIQRKHTISFEAFVRGKYTSASELAIHRDRMTNSERQAIKSGDWEELYSRVMADKDLRFMEREKRRARAMFESLNLEDFIAGAPTDIEEPSWEFPKGKRFVHETDLACALREFEEETCIPASDVVVFNPEAYCIEEFCGTNQKTYRNKYFVALAHPLTNGPFVDPANTCQIAEVKNTGWFSLEAAQNIMHDFCVEKKEALKASHEQVLAFFNLT
jgi:8-oxo-dGTP pyrophosphatase MutT (NUDIX family)